jgi:hypothetical protein
VAVVEGSDAKQGYLLATSRQMQHHYRLVAVDTAVNSEEERVQEGKERKGINKKYEFCSVEWKMYR